jgi:hypothetical protein
MRPVCKESGQAALGHASSAKKAKRPRRIVGRQRGVGLYHAGLVAAVRRRGSLAVEGVAPVAGVNDARIEETTHQEEKGRPSGAGGQWRRRARRRRRQWFSSAPGDGEAARWRGCHRLEARPG